MNRFTYLFAHILLILSPIYAAAQSPRSHLAVYFDLNQAKPKAGEWIKIDSLLATLPPDLPLTLIGHADFRASAQYNLALSKRRTESIQNYLVTKGIKAEQITARWEGEKAPVTQDTTQNALQLNRRVEIYWETSEGTAQQRNRAEFVFMAEMGLDTVTADGVHIQIAPNSMVNAQGKRVQGEVRLIFKNYRDKFDQMEAGFSLDFEKDGQWYLYNSAGMFSIFAYQQRDTLALMPGQTIRIEYPLLRDDLNLSFFRYIGAEENWRAQASLPKNPGETEPISPDVPPLNPPSNTKSADPQAPISNPNSQPIDPNNSPNPTPLSLAEKKETDEPDSLGIDTLSLRTQKLDAIQEKDNNCALCECHAGNLLFSITVQPNIPAGIHSSLDLYSLFMGYPNFQLVEQPNCKRIQLEWIPDPKRKKEGIISPSIDEFSFPYGPFLRWKLLSGARARKRGNWEGAGIADITILGNPLEGRTKLIFRNGLATQTFKAKLVLRNAKQYSGKNTRKEAKQYFSQLYAKAQKEANQNFQNAFKNWMNERVKCNGLLQSELHSIQSSAVWQNTPKEPTFSKVWEYLMECAPGGCCTETIIDRPDTIPIESFKTVLIEGGAIPIVLIDDFGVFNWDAIDTLPNPVELQVLFQDEKGIPIQAAKGFILVSEINGIIRLPYLGVPGKIKYSPAVTNHFLFIGMKGEIYYCTNEAFRSAVSKGGNPVQIPCTTIPHGIGDPPVDLRAVLPFR